MFTSRRKKFQTASSACIFILRLSTLAKQGLRSAADLVKTSQICIIYVRIWSLWKACVKVVLELRPSVLHKTRTRFLPPTSKATY
ncbi:hypothetical protein GDO78_004341 [Eleutherodactylus coqui]|uniref:Uncharacterized protein n=1 Tax=Eleutherodactylus coqui TaxID=57060 RepID=A0A8J6K078_ELECQ|nr:hypothetical protein GDO78_004341 [Eleutherodactylus coqui]